MTGGSPAAFLCLITVAITGPLFFFPVSVALRCLTVAFPLLVFSMLSLPTLVLHFFIPKFSICWHNLWL